MPDFDGFHPIAAARGDGLLPQLADLSRPAAHNIVELALYRAPAATVAGPATALSGPLPDNVLQLRPAHARTDAVPQPIVRRPRIGKAKSLARRHERRVEAVAAGVMTAAE